jgi:hypothetical protein
MRPGLQILLNFYELEDVAMRLPKHIGAAEYDARRFRDGSTTGLISVRERDAVYLRQYQVELFA